MGVRVQHSNKRQLSNRCIGLVGVDATPLLKSLGNQTGLALILSRTRLGLHLEDPLAVNQLLPYSGRVDERPSLVVAQRLHLLVHGRSPFVALVVASRLHRRVIWANPGIQLPCFK